MNFQPAPTPGSPFSRSSSVPANHAGSRPHDRATIARASARLLLLASLGLFTGCSTSPKTALPSIERPELTPTTTPAPATVSVDRVQIDLSLLRNIAVDPVDRRTAAVNILQSGPAGVQILLQEMQSTTQTSTKLAIAEALRVGDAPPPESMVSVLMDHLPRAEPSLQNAVAASLAKTQDVRLARTLTRQATDPNAPIAQRRGAILFLAYRKDRDSAAALMTLIEPRQPQAVRDAAFAALRQMTGLYDLESNADLWKRWWAARGDMPGDRWPGELMDNFSQLMENVARRAARTPPLEQRLISYMEQVYRLSPVEERNTLLTDYLRDPLDSVRQMGVRLVERRLTNGQLPDPDLRTALRQRLSDSVPKIRERAASFLRFANDEQAAALVSATLAAGSEREPEVLNAFLRLIARFPSSQAVPPALELLADPAVAGEAAGALAAAQRQGLLDLVQKQAALQGLREALQQARLPQPPMIQLLALIGSDEDWARILSWLDHADGGVKEAAAAAWAASDRPLVELARRCGDPVIQPIAIQAAMQRGDDARTFMHMLDHRPQPDAAIELWKRAVVAMASRVPPASVLEVDRRLAALNESLTLREQVLTTAVDRVDAGADPALLGELLLSRAEIRVSADPSSAEADYVRIAALHNRLTPEQLRRRDSGLIRSRLASGDTMGAWDLAKPLLNAKATPAERESLLAAFLIAGERYRAAGQHEQARAVATRLQDSFNAATPDSFRKRAAALMIAAPTNAPPNGTPVLNGPTTQPASAAAIVPPGTSPAVPGTVTRNPNGP